jgi:exosortase/archaeosortase family protein
MGTGKQKQTPKTTYAFQGMTSDADPPTASTPGVETDTNQHGATRAHAFRFMVGFLIITGSLLAGFHYSAGSQAMNWYLFQVTRGTVGLMTLLGHPARVGSFVSLPASPRDARLEIDRWIHGKDSAAANNAGSHTDESPLTPWEEFRFESATRLKTLAAEKTAIHDIQSLPKSTSGPISDINVSLEKFSAQAERISASASGLARLNQDWLAALNDTQSAVARLSAASSDDPQWDLVRQNASLLRTELEMVLQARVAAAESAVRGVGPVILYPPRKSGPTTPPIRIVSECGALETVAIFFAAVMVFPTTWRKRLLGLFLGLPVLLAVNIVRLGCLGILRDVVSNQEIFDFAHHYVWQGIYLIFVVIVWLLWMSLIVFRGQGQTGPVPLRTPLMLLMKFCVFLPLIAIPWWYIMPTYLLAIGKVSAFVLGSVFGYPFAGAEMVSAAGAVGETSLLSLPELRFLKSSGGTTTVGGVWSLAITLAAYVALTLATPNIGFRRLIRILAAGIGILAVCHILFIVLLKVFESTIRTSPELPTTIAEVFLTLPFLLWIVLAYWGQIRNLFSRERTTTPPTEPQAST